MKNKQEIVARVNAPNSAWHAMGSFWKPDAPKPVKTRIFRSLVVSAVSSGLFALVLNKSEAKILDNRLGFERDLWQRKINHFHPFPKGALVEQP